MNSSDNSNSASIEFEVIPFEEWRQRIQPLWPWQTDYHWIPLINNPYGMIQYTGQEVFERVIVFPVMCKVDGKPAAYTHIYNISDTHLRIRGIYVEPEFRGQRLATPMLDYACNLYPKPWHTVIGYYRTTTAEWCRDHLFHDFTSHGWRHRVLGDGSVEKGYQIILMKRRFRDESS